MGKAICINQIFYDQEEEQYRILWISPKAEFVYWIRLKSSSRIPKKVETAILTSYLEGGRLIEYEESFSYPKRFWMSREFMTGGDDGAIWNALRKKLELRNRTCTPIWQDTGKAGKHRTLLFRNIRNAEPGAGSVWGQRSVLAGRRTQNLLSGKSWTRMISIILRKQ